MLIVVALGGNAVSPPGKQGNIPAQFAATRAVVPQLAERIISGDRLVITHGNGPQVGNVMRRIELASDQVYPLPLDIVVADTQAGMGYMICQCLMNELSRRGRPRICTTIITTVRVDGNDPAMKHPAKPVGAFLSREQAQGHAEREGWKIAEDSGRGWRRVVPSPAPMEIVEMAVVKELVNLGHVVVAGGGGGIPVVRDRGGNYAGVEAVVDKDRTSALMALELGADLLAILTNVEQAQVDFGKPTARGVAKMSVGEARKLMAAGEFAAGSMLPKIEAAAEFVAASKKKNAEALITSCERFGEGMMGKTGTRVIREQVVQ